MKFKKGSIIQFRQDKDIENEIVLCVDKKNKFYLTHYTIFNNFFIGTIYFSDEDEYDLITSIFELDFELSKALKKEVNVYVKQARINNDFYLQYDKKMVQW